eukprot:SAG11_NODE_1497_length_4795_cov_18.378620_2_plen_484_part_00
MSAFFSQDTLDPMTIIDFAVVLNQRLEDKLLGNPIDARISGLSLCNLDRRADLTSIFVINEILAVEEDTELLFKLAIMRCGPNNPEGYRKLMKIIESSYVDVPRVLSLDLLVKNLEGYDGPWGRSYRRTLMTANTVTRAKLICFYKEETRSEDWDWLWQYPDSNKTYQFVLEMLGGGAKFAAYQVCLDLGYIYKKLYDEDEHVVIGPGCSIPEEDIETVKQELVPLLKMPVTKQTVEGLGCEYRKYQAGKPHYNQSSGNLEKYRAQYEESQRHLKEWNQSGVEKEEVSFAFSDSEEEEEPEDSEWKNLTQQEKVDRFIAELKARQPMDTDSEWWMENCDLAYDLGGEDCDDALEDVQLLRGTKEVFVVNMCAGGLVYDINEKFQGSVEGKFWYVADPTDVKAARWAMKEEEELEVYGEYVKRTLKVGMRIRMLRDFKKVCKGNVGTYLQTNDGMPPCQVKWETGPHAGNTYWVHWYDVEIIDA